MSWCADFIRSNPDARHRALLQTSIGEEIASSGVHDICTCRVCVSMVNMLRPAQRFHYDHKHAIWRVLPWTTSA